ncbi:hypothetical protein T12_3880 [Trichinella patagoniensis]|uniref:Uncharacterized protein n=1 Tax=Trichinella patagoniensis TaxID=990121 RepID=A0A0V0ZK92_9BILA|nr:hypothetical protein T12_3880 [Trichinella patagoniensis]
MALHSLFSLILTLNRMSAAKFDNETVELAEQLSVPISGKIVEYTESESYYKISKLKHAEKCDKDGIYLFSLEIIKTDCSIYEIWSDKPESECNTSLLAIIRPLKCLILAKFINKKFENFHGITCDTKLNINVEKNVKLCDLSWRESLKAYALRIPEIKRPWNENLFLYVPMLTNITDNSSEEDRKHPFGRTGVAGQGNLNKLGRNLHVTLIVYKRTTYPCVLSQRRNDGELHLPTYFLHKNTMSDYPFNKEMADTIKQGFRNHSNPSIKERSEELFAEAKRSTNTMGEMKAIGDSDTDDAWLEEVVAEIKHNQHVHLGNINFTPEMNSLSLEWKRVTEQIDEYIMELKRKAGEHYPEPYLTESELNQIDFKLTEVGC